MDDDYGYDCEGDCDDCDDGDDCGCYHDDCSLDHEYEGDFDLDFADPGGRSALRAGVRNHPCPTCGEPDRLTSKDVALGYQCDACADRAEGWGG